MKRTFRLLFTVGLMLMVPRRLPAPIQEIPESPSPAAEQSATARAKRTAKSKTRESPEPSTKRQEPSAKPQVEQRLSATPFAGTWIMERGILNPDNPTAPVTLIVSPAQDSAVVKGLPVWGDRR